MIVSITIALFVIGLFGLLMIHTQKLTRVIQENVAVQVFLTRNVTDAQKNRIERTLGTKDYVLKKDESPQFTFVSKEDAASSFIEETGEDFTEFLGSNPLRDSYSIRIDPGFQSDEQMISIKSDIEELEGVFEVVYVESLVHTVNQNVTKIGMVLAGLSLLLVLLVVILINNTIKLALFSQRFLIRSMQLVGGTSGFIQKPFLLRGSLHGVLSAVLAGGLLYGLLQYAYVRIEDLETLRDVNMFLGLGGILFIAGLFLGFYSTYRATRKYLKMSLDELY